VSLLQATVERLRRRDMLQILLLILIALLFAVSVSWPAAARPNVSWSTLSQVRSVALMLAASGFGVFSATREKRRERLETLLALFLFWPLVWPLEAATYAASYPDTALWWVLVVPLIDLGAYFGIGLALGLLTRVASFLWPLIPPLLLAGLIALSSYTQLPLLNPIANTANISWPHLALSALIAATTFWSCIRSRLGSNRGD
jgi:hypothetical protein